LAKMQPIAAVVEDRVVPFSLPDPQKLIASPLLRIEKASVGYSPDQPILCGLDLRIDNDDRIALLGQNGNGKSTFAKLIAGRLKPLTGDVFGAQKVDVGYFAQHQLDDLAPGHTPYDYMVKYLPDGTEAQRRTRLGTFGFSAQKADTKCSALSGGEKARLLLALTAFYGPHILILDEPTNHLDVDSREALIRALMEYNGAVILISHDRHLVEATADRLWIVRDGTVKSYDGDMETYRAELLSERGAKRRETRQDIDSAQSSASRTDQRRVAAQRRQELAPLKKAVQSAEQKIEKINRDIAAIDQQLADPDIYTRQPQKAQKSAQMRGQLAKQLADVEDEWMQASEAFDAALNDVVAGA
jgi:ATP-binding cassette, subfamily F, member 3